MPKFLKLLAAIVIGLGSLVVFAGSSGAQQSPPMAIDIALEPDATMIRHAQATNARLLKAYPKGFALDATHNPHITLLQAYVHTADLDEVYDTANKVLASEKPASWKLKAFKYYYIPMPPVGLAGIVVEPTDDLRRLQQRLVDAVARFTVKTGAAGAFFTTPRNPTSTRRRSNTSRRSFRWGPARNSIRTSRLALVPRRT